MDGDNIAVVMVNYRTPHETLRSLAALAAERELLPGIQVIVVDGCSGDGSAPLLEAASQSRQFRGWVTFLPLPINGGFGWANNQAIMTLLRNANPPEFIHLLNPDTVIFTGAVKALWETMLSNPRIAAAGSQLSNHTGGTAGSAFSFPSAAQELVRASKIFKLGRVLGVRPSSIHTNMQTNVDWVTGASCMLRSDALRECGLFDDGFFLYFEEVELMHRMHASGWIVRFVPESKVKHIGGAATGLNDNAQAGGKRKPQYWYESRKRYFALTNGRFYPYLASAAWLVGRALFRVRTFLTRLNKGAQNAPEAKDLIRYGLWVRRHDRMRSIVRYTDELGRLPAWINRGE